MTEVEKIEYAKTFIDKLANGINPLDDTLLPEGDIVNNVRLSRCFFYVSGILQKEIERERKKESNQKKILRPLSITSEQLQNFEYCHAPVSATVMAKRINETVADDTMESLSYRHIIQWLMNIGMLEYKEVREGKMKRTPTPEGEAVGIILEFWENSGGRRYPVIRYTEAAQRFIVDNIEAVVATKIKKGKTSYPWGLQAEEESDE